MLVRVDGVESGEDHGLDFFKAWKRLERGVGVVGNGIADFRVSDILDVRDQEPDFARFLARLGSYARVVTFDKRGTGMSDRVAELPGLDQRMDDLRARRITQRPERFRQVDVGRIIE